MHTDTMNAKSRTQPYITVVISDDVINEVGFQAIAFIDDKGFPGRKIVIDDSVITGTYP